jgi:FG-GAP repeat
MRRPGEPSHVSFLAARYGCSGRLAPIVRPSGPRARAGGSGVVYTGSAMNAGFDEWYVPTSRGLEQGFTLRDPPCDGDDAAEVTMEVRVGGLDAAARADGTGIDLRDALGAIRMRYSDLSVRDANGAPVGASMDGRGAIITLRIDARGAAFPLTVDPVAWFVTQQLVPSGTAMDTRFGSSVALSGTTALIGAPGQSVGSAANAGVAYAFTRTAGTWTLQQTLVASDAQSGDTVGFGVALDGDTAVVGMLGPLLGGAYVFVSSGTTWAQQQKLMDPVGNIEFGVAVAISGDTVVVGAPAIGAPSRPGAAYVFSRSGTTWSQQQVLQASDAGPFDTFGFALALTGSTLVVGAPSTTGTGRLGAAYVFSSTSGTWTQQQKLESSDDSANDAFGGALAISGTTVIVGAPGATIGVSANQGAAYVFGQSGGQWTQSQKLVATGGQAGDGFGSSVAVDGPTAIIGAPQTNNTGFPGSTYVFAETGGSWGQLQELGETAGAGGDTVGHSVALQAGTAVVGAPGIAVSGNQGVGGVLIEEVLSTVGTACTTASQCGSGFCTDGVCCNDACDQTCEACDVTPGTCSPVKGSPRGARTPCASSDPVCGGTCDGANVDACTYPLPGTPCGTTCSGRLETANTCDGKGTCVQGTPLACRNNLVCDGTNGCYTSCSKDADCVTSYRCSAGACEPGATCLNDHTAQSATGQTQNCGTYGCNQATEKCNTTCATVDDCSSPNVCDPTGACVAPPDTADALAGGCSLASRRGSPGGGWLALAALALLRSRTARRCPERRRAIASR